MRAPSTVCLPLILAFLAPTASDTTWFAPEVGLVLEKSLNGELRLELEDYELSVNGEPQELELPAVELDVAFAQSWRDLYRATSEGKPTDLEREYLAVLSTNSSNQNGEEVSMRRTSPLVGKKVRFTLGEAGGEYETRFVDEEGDEALLEDLRVAVDFLALLPEGEAKVGETWQGDLARFDEVFAPLGELHLVNEDGTERPDEPWSLLLEECVKTMEGEFEISLTRNTETGGRQLAEFSVRIDSMSSAEGEASRTRDTPGGPIETEIDRVATLGVELEGKLLWDLGAKHFVSFEVEGALKVTHEETERFAIGERDLEIDSKRVFAGTLKVLTEAETK